MEFVEFVVGRGGSALGESGAEGEEVDVEGEGGEVGADDGDFHGFIIGGGVDGGGVGSHGGVDGYVGGREG